MATASIYEGPQAFVVTRTAVRSVCLSLQTYTDCDIHTVICHTNKIYVTLLAFFVCLQPDCQHIHFNRINCNIRFLPVTFHSLSIASKCCRRNDYIRITHYLNLMMVILFHMGFLPSFRLLCGTFQIRMDFDFGERILANYVMCTHEVLRSLLSYLPEFCAPNHGSGLFLTTRDPK